MEDKPWETPLNAYVGVARIVEADPSMEIDCPDKLEQVKRVMSEWSEVQLPERPDILFRVSPAGNIAVTDAATGVLMGGQTAFYPYVLPQYRGRNLNAEMNFVLDTMNKRRGVSSYTPAGYYSRVATHRLHVERALAGGRKIPDGVMKDYIITGGRLSLREPYTAQAHSDWVGMQIREEGIERLARETAGYRAVFQTPEDIGNNDFQKYGPGHEGVLLAIGLHRELGSDFLIHIQRNRCFVQAEMDGMVVDCLGIRPTEMALEDLQNRDLLQKKEIKNPFIGVIKPGPVEVIRCADEAELFARLGTRWECLLPPFEDEGVSSALESTPGRRIRAALSPIDDLEMSL